jgi:hypothetical protein
MRDYSELRQLRPGGIAGRQCPQALQAVTALAGDDAEACTAVDLQLLRSAQSDADPLPLLALRCRVSHPLEAWLRATHRQHGERHGLDLLAMASYGLDDEGRLTLRTGPTTEVPFVYAELASLPKGLISPFSAEILRSYNPELCGLPHWSRLKIQAHNCLKAYFKDNGLLLISDWALLRHSSSKRVREACERFLRSSSSVESVVALHGRYQPLYDKALRDYKVRTGKASGWQPDQAFAEALDPGGSAFDTIELLKSIATAIRQFLTGSTTQRLDQLAEGGFEAVDPSSLQDPHSEQLDSAELRALIDAALQRAMDEHMPQVLAAAGKNPELLRCLWAGWSEGLKQRPLAECCSTSQGTVSKQLKPDQHATAMATAAAVELKRHPAFASCGSSVEAAERLVNALRNHLLEPEREGDIAPLRRWVQTHLSE